MIENPESEVMTLEAFQHLADAYGANLERWPDAKRSAATRLLAASATARASLVEARALDRLLDTPPMITGNAADLAERIIASASGSPSGARAGSVSDRPPARVIRLPLRSSPAIRPGPSEPRLSEPSPSENGTARPASHKTNRYWPAAAALAASLALGITLGTHDLTQLPVRGIVAIASADLDSDLDHFVAGLHADGIASGTDEERQ